RENWNGAPWLVKEVPVHLPPPVLRGTGETHQFNRERNHESLKNRYLWGMEQGLFYVARELTPVDPADPAKGETAKVVGVSSWLPPHPLSEGITWSMWWSDWKLSLRQLVTNARFMGRGGLDVHRYHIWKEVQDEAIKEDWTDKRGYYFCNVIAVLPGQQGKGIGKKLIEVVTRRADEEGLHCYLESSKAYPNLQIYEKFGFETVKEITCRDGDARCTVSLGPLALVACDCGGGTDSPPRSCGAWSALLSILRGTSRRSSRRRAEKGHEQRGCLCHTLLGRSCRPCSSTEGL
ncbi:hypothetical protein KEM52_003733, partial [Ascosphaera acerosa]